MAYHNRLKIVPMAGLLASVLAAAPASAAKSAALRDVEPDALPSFVSQAQDQVQLGMQDMDSGDYSAAIAHLAKATKFAGTSSTYFLLGYAHYQRGFAKGSPETADKQDAADALAAYAQTLALDPKLETLTRPELLYFTSAMCQEALGQNPKALAAYRLAIANDPANPMIPVYAARLRDKMNDAAKSAENLSLGWSKARNAHQRAQVMAQLSTNPLFASLSKSPAALAMAAPKPRRSAAMEDFIADARADLGGEFGVRDAVRDTKLPARPALREKDQEVLDRLADADEKARFREWRRAIDAYGQVLELDKASGVLGPDRAAQVYEKIGSCYNRLGLSELAIRSLQEAVKRQPADSAAHYQLALAYSLSGLYTDAIRALRATFEQAPTKAELRRYVMLSKTDSELEPVRDLPDYRRLLRARR